MASKMGAWRLRHAISLQTAFLVAVSTTALAVAPLITLHAQAPGSSMRGLVILAAGGSETGAAQTASASISGRVVTADGTAVTGTVITANHTAPVTSAIDPPLPPVVTGAMAAFAITDAQGAFRLDGLPAGEFVLCAQVHTPGLLANCHWSARAPVVSVGQDQAATGAEVRIETGAVLAVVVEDPLNLLPPKASGSVQPLASVSGAAAGAGVHGGVAAARDAPGISVAIVTLPRLFHGATPVQNAGRALEFSVTVPFDAHVHLAVSSSSFQFTHQSADVSEGQLIPVVRHRGSENPPVVFQVRGRR